MKEGYEGVRREESAESIESGASSLLSAEPLHQRPLGRRALLVGLSVLAIVAVSTGALTYSWHMHTASTGGLSSRGAKKVGAGLLLW